LSIVFKGAGAVVKIGLSLKPNHHKEIKHAQICETLCSKNTDNYFLLEARGILVPFATTPYLIIRWPVGPIPFLVFHGKIIYPSSCEVNDF